VQVVLGVQHQPRVSTAVVSTALATSAMTAPERNARSAPCFDHRIKSLSGASSPGFMGVRAAAQPGIAYSAEPGRTAVNCNPNCNPRS
jgi:hypothetical protein